MFKHLVNAPYVLNVLVPSDIFFKIHVSGNPPSKFTSLEDDYSIHLKLNPPGPFKHNEILIWSPPKPKRCCLHVLLSEVSDYAGRAGSVLCSLYPEGHTSRGRRRQVEEEPTVNHGGSVAW